MQNTVVRYLVVILLFCWVYLLPPVWELGFHAFALIAAQIPAIAYAEAALRYSLIFSKKHQVKISLNSSEEIRIYDIHGRVIHKLNKLVVQRINKCCPLLAERLRKKFFSNFIIGLLGYYGLIIIAFVLSQHLYS